MRRRSPSFVSSLRGLGRLGIGMACGLLAAGLSLPAQAGEGVAPRGPSEAEAPTEPTVVGDAQMGIFAEGRRDRSVISVSPQVRMGMRPREEVELHVSFGAVSVFSVTEFGQTQDTRPSNLSFGGSGVIDRRGDRWRYAKIGFSFVIPSAYATSPLEEEAYEYALGGRLGWDPWSWMPQTFGLVVPGEVRAQAGRRWVIGADGAIAALLPSARRTDGMAAAAQVAAQARFVTRRMGLGLRLAAVWNGRHPDDQSQAGISPFIDTSLCRRGSGRRIRGERARTSNACPLYATGRINLNFDGPYGFAGEDAMRVWGMQVGLGWAVY